MTLPVNKPKHYDGNYINIVTWNVQGLVKDTVDDTMLCSCVNNNDVIILTETWLQGEMDILPTKYFTFHNIRVNSKKSRGGHLEASLSSLEKTCTVIVIKISTKSRC